MGQGHGKRPDGKAIELPSEKLARQQMDKNLDARAQDAQRALEKAQGGKEVDAEVAAQLQKGMGNSALAAMVKQGTETDTATTSAEATLDEAREEEVEEEGEEKEAGEIEHVLPSFSTGGGGGGGPGGSPWAVGKYFGGDGDDDGEVIAVGGPRWRPMPVLPDPDEDVDLEDVDGAEEPDPEALASLVAARAALGDARGSPATLSRGLRHVGRLVSRRVLAADGQADPVWSRARAMVRFLAEHAPHAEGRALAALAADLGVHEGESLVLAVARELAIDEREQAPLGVGWHAVVDVAGDQRARARVEQAAAALAPSGRLGAPDLLATVLGEAVPPVSPVDVPAPHGAALHAVRRASRLGPVPSIEGWRAPVPAVDPDPALAFIDGILAAGAPDSGTAELPGLSALYDRMNVLLAAVGVAQVEGASAALAAWPWMPDGLAEGVVAELDEGLRSAARRLVEVGGRIEAAAARGDVAEVEELAAAAAGIAPLVALLRDQAVGRVAGLLLPEAAAPADGSPPGHDVQQVASLVERGRTAEARVLAMAGTTLHHAAWAARIDGAAAAVPVLARVDGPDAALGRLAAVMASAGPAAATTVPVPPGAISGPYGMAWIQLCRLQSLPGAVERRAAIGRVAAHAREAGEGAVLNLLKAAWVEVG